MIRKFEVLDLNRALAKIIFRLGLKLLGRLQRRLRRLPLLDNLLPRLLLEFRLALELELGLAGSREPVLRLPDRSGRPLDLLGIGFGLGRKCYQSLREFLVLTLELSASRLVGFDCGGELFDLLGEGVTGLGHVRKRLVESGKRDLLCVELLLELESRGASGLRDLVVDRLDRLRQLLIARGQLGPGGLQAVDLRPGGLDLLLARREFLFGDPVAGAREPGFGPVLVLLELLVLDGLEALAFEGPQVVLDLPEKGLDPLQIRVEVGPLGGRAVQFFVILTDPREPLEETPPRDRAHRDDLVDVPLLDEVVSVAAEAAVGKDRIDFRLGRSLSVDVEVGVVPVRIRGGQFDVPGDLHLRRIDGQKLVRVVEDERDLALRGGLLGRPAVEEEMGQSLGSQGLRTRGAQDEQDRVRDVRFSHPVRAGDPGESGLEWDLGRTGERLEVSELDALQIHRAFLLSAYP